MGKHVWILCAAALLLATDCGSVFASTYTVMNLNDNGAGSLRQAILDANANAGADTVDFAAGLTGTIGLATSSPVIGDDLTIDGPRSRLDRCRRPEQRV